MHFSSFSSRAAPQFAQGQPWVSGKEEVVNAKKWLQFFVQILVQHLSEVQRNAHRQALGIIARVRNHVCVLFVKIKEGLFE